MTVITADHDREEAQRLLRGLAEPYHSVKEAFRNLQTRTGWTRNQLRKIWYGERAKIAHHEIEYLRRKLQMARGAVHDMQKTAAADDIQAQFADMLERMEQLKSAIERMSR